MSFTSIRLRTVERLTTEPIVRWWTRTCTCTYR